MLEVTKCAPQMAIIQLGQAFQNFFAGRARYPQFRKKGRDDRFTLSNDQFDIDASRMRIQPRFGMRMREMLRFSGKIMSAAISRAADRWFVSITVDTPDNLHLPKAENQGVVGVDLGVSALATLSTGEPPIPGPKPHKALLDRLRRLSRSLSRKQKGSTNRKKAKLKLVMQAAHHALGAEFPRASRVGRIHPMLACFNGAKAFERPDSTAPRTTPEPRGLPNSFLWRW